MTTSTTSASPYQVMPPLTPEEYAALEADIRARGVLVPVVVDQHGNTIDGHNRAAIAHRLGITYPTETREVPDDEHARDLAYTLNLNRRHLTRDQKRNLIAAEITRRPDDTDRAIGRRLACDHKTVGSVRRELSGEIPHPSLSPAQRRRSGMLLSAMKGRTLAACEKLSNPFENTPFSCWTLATPLEVDDPDVFIDAWIQFEEWANTADETRWTLWEPAPELTEAH